MFPLKDYKYDIPKGSDNQGAFGAIRRFDIHTGVDLYCEEGDEVLATENGIIIDIIDFTGVVAGSPWWNDTKAVILKTSTKFILFGELTPTYLQLGQYVTEGTILGHIIPVLKLNKGLVPSNNMLHMEQYNDLMKEAVIWNLNEDKPIALEDITPYLEKLKDP